MLGKDTPPPNPILWSTLRQRWVNPNEGFALLMLYQLLLGCSVGDVIVLPTMRLSRVVECHPQHALQQDQLAAMPFTKRQLDIVPSLRGCSVPRVQECSGFACNGRMVVE